MRPYKHYEDISAATWAVIAAILILGIAAAAQGQQRPPQAPVIELPAQAPSVEFRYDCRCEETGICTCPPGTCDCPACDLYTKARQQAVRENKPLVVWRGWTCPSCVAKLPGAVHVSVSNTDKRFASYIQSGVILSYLRDGELYCVAEIPAGDSGTVTAALQSKMEYYGRFTAKAVTVPFVPARYSTAGIVARPAVSASFGLPGTTGTGHIPTFAPAAVRFGSTNFGCATGRG